ncbi:Hypothetical predicted protein [Cloeon dipterum]|uniref:Coilin n=1 Tax=Cloeon dipterum TaxID=197152 RepID=A0A8S1CJ47_9INSE|nr:Hypothetical predicted protein [Cloeon dipterum]
MDKIVSRVRIDLSEFYRDERKSCLKSLDYSALKKVSDLKNYIVTEMGILGQTQLMLGNSILLGSDDLRVIRDGDELKLVSYDFNCLHSGRKSNVLEPADDHSEATSSMSVCSDDGLKATVQSSLAAQAAENFKNTVSQEGLEWMKEPLPKRKRSRRGRKKKAEETSSENGSAAPPKSHRFVPHKKFKQASPDPKHHVKFDLKAEEDLPSNELTPPSQIRPGKINPSTPVKENGNEEPPVVFKRDFRKETVRIENPYQTMSDQELFDLPPVTKVPNIGETIAFRVLFVNEDCVPELSGWLIGNVIDEVEAVINLKLIRGTNPKYQRRNDKFSIDDDGPEEIEDFMSLPFEELATPRLLPSD